MPIIENYSSSYYINELDDCVGTFQAKVKQKSDSENFEIEKKGTKSKKLEWFELLYGYPPQFKIKWENLDELKQDTLVKSKTGILEHSFPFMNFSDDDFLPESAKVGVGENYTMSQYFDGYLDKVNTTNFYKQKTKDLQSALRKIPVFVILNSNGEIVLAKPNSEVRVPTWQQIKKGGPLKTKTKRLRKQNLQNIFNEKIYDFCGAFDSRVEKASQLGLFFMSWDDADAYLKEVATSDINGTRAVGLSIHYVGLDAAYRITREHHPGIDFRFIPDLNAVKNLLVQDIGKADSIVADEQQQLRVSPRGINLFPFLGKYGRSISVGTSFVQKNEYFKGVPVYIVQISENPRNLLFEQYFKVVGTLDNFYGKSIKSFNSLFGFGNNSIIEGPQQGGNKSKKLVNYIFFDKDQAGTFVKKQGRKVARYSGSRTPNLELLVRKPKIFIYNLEDLIESWEDKLKVEALGSTKSQSNKSLLNAKTNYFIPPVIDTNEILSFKDTSQTFNKWQQIKTSFSVKARVLKRSLSMWLVSLS